MKHARYLAVILCTILLFSSGVAEAQQRFGAPSRSQKSLIKKPAVKKSVVKKPGRIGGATACDMTGTWKTDKRVTWTFVPTNKKKGLYAAEAKGRTGTAVLDKGKLRIFYKHGATRKGERMGFYDLAFKTGCKKANGRWSDSFGLKGFASLSFVKRSTPSGKKQAVSTAGGSQASAPAQPGSAPDEKLSYAKGSGGACGGGMGVGDVYRSTKTAIKPYTRDPRYGASCAAATYPGPIAHWISCVDGLAKAGKWVKIEALTAKSWKSGLSALGGPRTLEFRKIYTGRLVSTRGRNFITPAPINKNSVTIRIKKIAGKAKTSVKVCSHTPDGKKYDEWTFTIPNGRKNIGKQWTKTIRGIRGRIITVHLDSKSTANTFRYELSATRR